LKKKRPKRSKQQFTVLPGGGRRFSFTRLKQALVFYVFLLLALVLIAQLGYHWLGEQFLAWRLQIVEAEKGVLEHKTEAAGLITRREKIIRAPSSGMVLKLTSPGDRIPAGTELAVFGVLPKEKIEELKESGDDKADDLWKQFADHWQGFFNRENDDDHGPAGDPEGEEREDLPGDDEHGPENEIVKSTAFEEIITFYNEQSGLLSYYIDGWEGYNEPVHMTEEAYLENMPEGKFIEEGELVEAGGPLLKIVNNWEWFFNLVLPLHPGRELTGYNRVDIEFKFAPEEKVRADLYHFEIDESSQEVHLTYRIDRQISGFEQVRWAEASLLYRRQEGIIIPAEAVVKKDGLTGVYLNKGGRVVFEPVTVIERRGEKTLVEGLDRYSLVISRPDLVEEGQRLN